MATINRKPIRPVQVKRTTVSDNDCNKYYNSIAWHRFRKTYKSEHPLCQCCLSHNRIEPAVDLHHRKPFLSGATEEDRWDLFLKESNIIALCECCHYAMHNKIEQYNLDYCDELTEKEWQEAHSLK